LSWPRSVGQEPLHYDTMSTGRPARNTDLARPPKNPPEKYVSRYIDEQNSPQFPFGFGLSYITYRYANLKVDRTELSAKSMNASLATSRHSEIPVVNLSAQITNTGTRAGAETVELYANLRGTSVVQPIRALVGFEHVVLAAGETKELKFSLGPEAFAFWNEENKF